MNLTQWGETVTESRVPNYTSSHFITTFSQPHSFFFLPSQPFSLSIFHSQISIHTFNCNNLQLQQCPYLILKPPMAVVVDPSTSLFVISAAIVRSLSFLFSHLFFHSFLLVSVVSRATIRIVDSLNNWYIDQIHQLFIHRLSINWYVDQIHQLFVELLFIIWDRREYMQRFFGC
jgi:hypothetical protein